ncbi:MAG: type II secretion system F family protein [Dehalococcoidia bacterium]|nr:MAG: type II secretion system F family protein [Dehalococcoidia bacterium]
MEYAYVAYTEDRRLVTGKLSATSEEVATNLLSYGGYQVVSLRQIIPFFNMEKLTAAFSRIKPREIIMFSRQLALLLESGTDIVTSLELLQSQVTNRPLKKIIGEVASDIRSGTSLSIALSRHPQAFTPVYYRAIAAGEQGGNLEVVLRQMADYIERGVITEKKIKNALTYPIIVVIVAFVVIILLVTFVLPTFISLFTSFGAELPLPTRMLIAATDWLGQYGLYLILTILAAVTIAWIYIRTPAGKYRWHKLSLNLPVLGRIFLLNELSRACRTMALLFKVGLPLPEIMAMVIHGSTNEAMVEALTEVQEELIRGEGLSRPMAKREYFLPLMVQMTGVGEETGNLDNTLITVAQSYEAESDDRTGSAVGLIQPVMTIIIGLLVGFIAVAMFGAMYSIYGQMSL